MKIQWKIEKRRGNFRPLLKYSMHLVEHEKSLAMHAVSIESSIPAIDDLGQIYCMPDCDERRSDWQPRRYHHLTVPYFKNGMNSGSIRLPFRESGEYREVKESFARLRETYEQAVQRAYCWEPISINDELDITVDTKK